MIQLLIWKFFVSSSFFFLFFLKAYCSSKKQVTFMFKLVDAIYCWSGAACVSSLCHYITQIILFI